MVVLGITGGVGCGKSYIADYLKKKYKAVLLQADEIGRELEEPGGAAYEVLADLIGREYLLKDGRLNRAMLAERLFADPGLRDRVNGIVHPLVSQRIVNRIDELYERDEDTLVVIEAALLIEGELDLLCDEVWYIHASEEVRTKRLIEDRGYSQEKVRAIMDAQLTEQQFKEYCDYTIDNNGDFDKTVRQICALLG